MMWAPRGDVLETNDIAQQTANKQRGHFKAALAAKSANSISLVPSLKKPTLMPSDRDTRLRIWAGDSEAQTQGAYQTKAMVNNFVAKGVSAMLESKRATLQSMIRDDEASRGDDGDACAAGLEKFIRCDIGDMSVDEVVAISNAFQMSDATRGRYSVKVLKDQEMQTIFGLLSCVLCAKQMSEQLPMFHVLCNLCFVLTVIPRYCRHRLCAFRAIQLLRCW